jgi:hypothetical protein
MISLITSSTTNPRVFGGRMKESIFGWRWFDLRIVMKCSERYIGAYIFFIVQWIGFKF